MNKQDKPLILSSQCIIDWENILDLTFQSNGQIISIHRNENGDLEISGIGTPLTLQRCTEKTSKRFKEIMNQADKYSTELKSGKFNHFNRTMLEWRDKCQEEFKKMKDFEKQKELEEIEKVNETNTENTLSNE